MRHISIALAALAGSVFSSFPLAAQTVAHSVAAVRAEAGLSLIRLSGEAMDALEAGKGEVRIAGVPLPGVDSPVTLLLKPFTAVTPGVRMVIGSTTGPDREFNFDWSSVKNFRGRVEGVSGSHVFLSLGNHASTGRIEVPGMPTIAFSNIDGGGLDMGPGGLSLFPVQANAAMGSGTSGCGTRPTAAEVSSALASVRSAQLDSGATNIKNLRQIEIAVETDFEYFSLFGDLQAAGEYVVQTYAAISDIYIRDVNSRVDLAFVRLWDDPNDLFNELEPLSPFQNYWNANMQSVERDVAQFFTGRRNLTAGGVAFLNGLCNNNSYSWAGYVLGFFSNPLVPGVFTRDVVVAAHEIGHNCNTPHTHDLGLDTCDDQNTQPRRGTIMSYCGQTFTGGEGNADIRFHAATQQIMEAYITTRGCVATDCNQNMIPDGDDILAGTSLDTNANGTPDECEDCNTNGILDPEEIAMGLVMDLNANGIPDTCDPDCNGNGIPDDLDLSGSLGTPVFSDNFNTNTGWTFENLGATAGVWERGVPVNDPGWQYDPMADGDGSGSCLLTQNALGNTDVDNGATRATSPVLDFSQGGLGFSFLYYLNLTNASGVDQILVEVSDNDLAGPWQPVLVLDTNGDTGWRLATVSDQQIAAAGLLQTSTMRVRFTINDGNPQSIVEGGIDAFAVRPVLSPVSDDLDFNNVPDECQPDLDNNGVLDWFQIIQNMALDLNRNTIFDDYEDCDNDEVIDLVELDAAFDAWVGHHDVAGNLKRYQAMLGTQTGQTAGGVVNTPNDVVVNKADGHVLVTSGGDDRVVEFDRHGVQVRDLVASGAGGLDNPATMLISGSSLYVVSTGDASVKQFSLATGAFVKNLVAPGAGGLAAPFGIALSGNRLFVTDGGNRVLEYAFDTGAFAGVFVGAGSGGLSTPRGLLVHPDTGNLLVCSFNTDQVLEYDSATGAFIKQWHSGGTPSPERLWLNNPFCIRVGRDGDIYVSRHNVDPLVPPHALHLTNASIFHYDRAQGYLKRAFVQGVNAGLHHPTGFDFLTGDETDCNFNQIPDECDILNGFSKDVNMNGKPDECEGAICYADCDGSGSLDFFDFLCFQNAFANGSTYADCDASGSLDFFDFLCYQNAFAAGCP